MAAQLALALGLASNASMGLTLFNHRHKIVHKTRPKNEKKKRSSNIGSMGNMGNRCRFPKRTDNKRSKTCTLQLQRTNR
ncbi:hypothetical protein ACLKA7_006487 [Drosophila subpalustris]